MASKSVFVGIQIAVSTALIAAHITMLGFFIYAIGFVFNKYNDFLALITSMNSSSELSAVVINIMQAIGIINAFNDVFNIFSPFIVAYLLFRSAQIVFHSFQATSNELFKVGVLTQQ
ncbi:MAG: hypothetical protein Q7R95_01790 [bacterium]|nr:hypothetical protein [bacterium]